MTQPRPRVLFVHHTDAADLLEDRALLESSYAVAVFRFRPPAGDGPLIKIVGYLREAGRQLRWLRQELPGAALVYCCFADYHTVLPATLGRWHGIPIAIRLGGYDGNTLPELGYGVFASRWRAPLARWALRQANHLLPVTPALMGHANDFARWPVHHVDGLRAHLPDLQVPFTALPTGYRSTDWPLGPAQRRPLVATVAYLDRERTVRIKGVDLLIAAARTLPEVEFRVVGVSPVYAPALRALLDPPGNVRLLPPVPRAELLAHYQEASVYAQLSRSEGGLPNVLGEAMLCGCVPLVSAVGAMPETTAGLGAVVAHPLVEEVAAGVRSALALGEDPARRELIREAIATRYPLDGRRQQLLALIDRLVGSAPPPGLQGR